MKKIQNKYAIELQSEDGSPLANEAAAVRFACLAAQYFAHRGLLTSVYLSKEIETYEVSIQFKLTDETTLPTAIHHSGYIISSHEYYDHGKVTRVRVKTFNFKTQK